MKVFGKEVQVTFGDDPEYFPKFEVLSNGMYSLEEGTTPYYKAKVEWEGKEIELPGSYMRREKDNIPLEEDIKFYLFGVYSDRLDEDLIIDYQGSKVWINGELLPGEFMGQGDPKIMDFIRDYYQLDLSLPELLKRFYNN